MSIRKHKNDRFKTLHGETTRSTFAKQKADKRNAKPGKFASQGVKDRKLEAKKVKIQKWLDKQKGKDAINKMLVKKNAI